MTAGVNPTAVSIAFEPTLDGLGDVVSSARLAGIPGNATLTSVEMLFDQPELSFEWENYA